MSAHEFSLSSTRVLTMVICCIPLVPPKLPVCCTAAGSRALCQICCCDRPMTHLRHQSLISGPIAMSLSCWWLVSILSPCATGPIPPTQRPAAHSLLCHRSNSGPLSQLLQDFTVGRRAHHFSMEMGMVGGYWR